MKPIVMQFVESKDLGGKLIEWFDHGRFAHVDTVMPDGTLLGARSEVIDGVPAGVQFRPANYLPDSLYKFRVELPCIDVISDKYYDFVISQIGKEYDWEAIAGFVTGRNWMDPSKWFCSELNAAGLVECGYLNPLSAPANKIAPDDLLLVLSGVLELDLRPV